jgi:TonB family protein
VFLDKIHSGFLLFETPQGLARIELSPRERIYLLWTFRNFRQLSVALLNSRERELVTSLFRNSPEIVSDDQDRSLVIGVVENFVPPAPLPPASTIRNPAPETIAPKVVGFEPAQPEARPIPIADPSWIAAEPALAKLEVAASEIAATDFEATAVEVKKSTPVRLTTAQRKTRRVAAQLATSLAALCLCIASVAAWHRIQGLPISHAYSRPQLQQINAIASPNSSIAAAPADRAPENPAPENRGADNRVEDNRANDHLTQSSHSAAPTAVTPERVATSEAALKSASITTASPTVVLTHTEKTASSARRATGLHAAESASDVLAAPNAAIPASRPPLHFVYPDYSDVRARGVVSLKADLDPAGNVRAVKLISGNRALAAAALRAVRHWRYRPYVKNGEPVATETYIVISFISDDAVSMSFPPSITAAR